MDAKSAQCPGCGQPAEGRFCSHCGTAIACPSCGTRVKLGARVCHGCGAALTMTPRHWNAQTIAPWVALGVATVAVVIAMVSWMDRGNRAEPPVPLPLPLTSTAPAPGESVDLSNMTPRQAADRLFNRIMAANERGDTKEALQFVPMALQAYDLAGTLDNDARFHVALIHLTAGDIQSARAQLDSIRQSVPNHLLGIMLAHDIAERSGNQDTAARAYQSFLAAYDAQMAVGRPEYEDHRAGIERFRKAAEASLARRK